MKTKVSIITVAYNCQDVIEKNITSCIGVPHIEHIIIDNNSSDNTLEIIKKYSKQVIIISNKSNLGFTKANNQGIDVAKGKYIFLLNPDAYILPDTINQLLNVIENDPQIGAVAPILTFADNSIQNYTRTFPTPFALFVESFIPRRFWMKFKSYRKYTYYNIDFSKVNEVDQPAGAAILFKNNFRLDEKYFIYVSDVELCKNIVDEGYKIIQTPTARVVHYLSKGGTNTTNTTLQMYLDLDNYFGIQYFFRKHKQIKNLILYKILFSLSLFFIGIMSLILGKGSIKIKRFIYFCKAYNFRNFEKNI